jgi:hypothetical protein
MVNLTIGNGTRTGGYATSFSKINWTTGGKKLVVKINTTGTCASYTEISNQPLMFVPYALFADNANVADGAITAAKLADGTITDAKIGAGISASKVGLGNVNNTSDANKPVSIAAQAALDNKENTTNKSKDVTLGTSDVFFPTQNAVKTYVDGKVSGSTIVDANATTKGKIQLAGDLAGTADAPTVPALTTKVDKVSGKVLSTNDYTTAEQTKLAAITGTNTGDQDLSSLATKVTVAFKEDTLNKSQVITSGLSNDKYPSVNAVKTYVDGAVVSGAPDADLSTKGKIQLAGDLGGTAVAPTVPALTNKVDKVIGKGLSANDYTNAEKSKLGAIAGTNTGDQDLSGKVDKVSGKDLSTNDYSTIEKSKLGAITGTNTGDETATTIKTKLGITTLSGINTGDQDLSSLATKTAVALKQDADKLSTDVQKDIAANDKYPSVNAIVTYVNALQAAGGVPPANTTALGTIKIAGDLGGTANSPSVPALANKVDKVNGERLISAAEITKLTAITGTNTGDQTLPTLTSLGAVAGNTAITGATKTKLTYDAKGLVTAGVDATTADIAPSTNRNYVTDAQVTVIAATSGANTGDQDLSGYALLTAIDGKENITNKSADGSLGTNSDALYPTEKAVKTYVNGVDLALINKINGVKSTVTANETAANSAIASKEDAANKSTDGTLATNSTTFFPTVRAVKTYVDAAKSALQTNIDAVQTDVTSNKTTVNNAISLKEDAANKSNDATLAGNSTTSFPTQQAVKTYIDTKTAAVNATNANLTGPITSSGNATAVASQTGTGSTFVMNTSPTLVTPNLGTPSALVGTNITLLPLATAVTGNLSVANGGTGVNTLTGYVKGNGTSAFTSSSTIPVADVAGAVKTVNGNSPVNGNVSISFGSVVTGSLASRTVNPGTNGNIFVVSGDSNTADNGRTFISDGANWQEVTANQAATDNRYVQLAGSTMLGNLAFPTGKKATMADAPSGSTDLVNKNYVDTQISNASPVASSTVKGIIKLAGDLAGSGSTADAPVISANAITTAKIADASVTSAKLDATGVAANTYGSTTAIPVITVDTKGRITAINTTTISATLIEVVEEFLTPTAAQTSFTFTQTPAANTKVKMYINGVLIKGSAVTVSAKVLTYNPVKNGNYAISVGDEVVFYYYY